MTGFTIAWHDSTSPLGVPSARVDDFPADAQHWRGVRDTSAALWLIPCHLDAPTTEALTNQHGFASGCVRKLEIIKEWGSVFGKALPLANFVLREMKPEALDSFLPLHDRQMSQVVQRPGCLGSILSAEIGAPHHLLGITFWEAERSFVQYMGWFAKHSWKYTVDPVTANVPLRMLTRRTEAPEQTTEEG